jgi:mono/diheme cytochrome c family protein
MRKLVLILVLALVLGLAACGGDSAPAGDESQAVGEGDVTAGKDLFVQGLIGTQAGCATCHSLEPGLIGLGPSLAAAGAEAGGRVEGASAAVYLRESILAPNAYLVEGFAGIMPVTYGDELTEQQVADLVAFLLTLE